MNCKDVLDLMQHFADNELDAKTRKSVKQHINTCKNCHIAYSQAQQLADTARQALVGEAKAPRKLAKSISQAISPGPALGRYRYPFFNKKTYTIGLSLTVVVAVVLLAGFFLLSPTGEKGGRVEAMEIPADSGSLNVINDQGKVIGVCPLKHTNVHTEISGYIARVEVTQYFHNPYKDKIEAVYTFPLSRNAAVDAMLMTVGDRVIEGEIKKREEARRIYERAKDAGYVASLLEQERPNIFTQSVANIMPGENVKITISYVETLKFEDGWFEFVFPTVVGPRYIPGHPVSRQPEIPTELEGKVVKADVPDSTADPSGTGWSPDTSQVPDASRITPLVTLPETRSGHTISIEVEIDAGASLRDVESELHAITTRKDGTRTKISLKDKDTIPNKDFILRYTTAPSQIEDTILTHASGLDNFLTLILQPPAKVKSSQITSKEMVFVLDTSGSMSGAPIEKAKQSMFYCLDNLNPNDTFNLITFSGNTRILFPAPVPATKANIKKATDLLAQQQGYGGTEMMKAIVAALEPSDSQKHLRIVCFMTDGYVGNDMAIIAEIQRHPNARIFSFGIGNSVNRFLLDNMAKAGRGEVQYVNLGSDEKDAAETFYERLRNPVLTDIEIDWGGLPITEVYPEMIPDLFSSQPVLVHARYTGAAKGAIKLHGKVAGKPFERTVEVDLPKHREENAVLGTLWARAKVEHLMNQDWLGMQLSKPGPDIADAITELGLRYRLVTQYTSFVAVEKLVVTEGGKPRTVSVPVEMPEGVSYEGVFDEERRVGLNGPIWNNKAAPAGGPPAIPVWTVPRPGIKGARIRSFSEKKYIDARDMISNPQNGNTREQLLKRKLASELRDLPATLKRLGRNGNLTTDKIRVKDNKVALSVLLKDDSDKNITQLKKLGFVELARAKSVKMIVGTINVAKIEELALLDFVTWVEPSI